MSMTSTLTYCHDQIESNFFRVIFFKIYIQNRWRKTCYDFKFISEKMEAWSDGFDSDLIFKELNEEHDTRESP